jgi:CheY-like chemotaxis protein
LIDTKGKNRSFISFRMTKRKIRTNQVGVWQWNYYPREDPVSIIRILFITDIMMPVMDGLEMLKHVHTSNTSVPAIILSAVEASDSLNQSNDFGVVRHETKTLSRVKLKVTLLECANDLLERPKQQNI